MKRMDLVVALFAAACLLLAGCSSAAPAAMANAPTPEMSPTAGGAAVNGAANAAVIGPDREGGTIKLKVGDTFDVKIPTIPKEGFTWQPVKLDTSILEQIGEAVYTPDTSPNSAGGVVTVTFRVVGPGTAPLTLLYQQSSQGGGPAFSSHSFGLTVEATP
ncbi:MAG TPA: protease inhibitor I42 family protein [Anaerolineales bacterium]|nr:protease inhibitor I42 family protein [Anaerolineales bacterium]